ncbi:MAG: asparagine synthase-related protein [Clostridia bacterium]
MINKILIQKFYDFSIETRLSYLEYKLIEIVILIPLKYKIKNVCIKNVLRETIKYLIISNQKILRKKNKKVLMKKENKDIRWKF